MKIFNPTLKGDKIQYWESPEPKRSDYKLQAQYDADFGQWFDSKKTLDVHPSAVENIIIALKEHLKAWPKGYFDNLNGIPLSVIEDRLEIKSNCAIKGSCGCETEKCDYPGNSFILKPLPSKEETQSDMSEFDINHMKLIVPFYIADLGEINCNELRFIIKTFLNQNPDFKPKTNPY